MVGENDWEAPDDEELSSFRDYPEFDPDPVAETGMDYMLRLEEARKISPIWEADMLPVIGNLAEYIRRDHPKGYLRYIHFPSGQTLLQTEISVECSTLDAWRIERDTFLVQFTPETPVVSEHRNLVGWICDAIEFHGFER